MLGVSIPQTGLHQVGCARPCSAEACWLCRLLWLTERWLWICGCTREQGAPAGAWQGWVSGTASSHEQRRNTGVHQVMSTCVWGNKHWTWPHLGTPSDAQILALRDSITVVGVNKVECFQSTGRRQGFCLVGFFLEILEKLIKESHFLWWQLWLSWASLMLLM